MRRTRLRARRGPDERDERDERMFALVEAHQAALIGYARRRVPDRADAADLVCDVLVVAWRRIDEVPDGDAARLWLYGVARNVLANHRRAVRRRGRLAERLRDHVVTAVSEVPDPASTPQVNAVRDALAALSSTDRELIALSAWEGLAPSEIAAVLDIEPGTARVRLHRARARLRQLLATEHGLQRDDGAGQVGAGRATARPGTQEIAR